MTTQDVTASPTNYKGDPTWATQDANVSPHHQAEDPARTEQDVNGSSIHTNTTNNEMIYTDYGTQNHKAMLYSLSTPGNSEVYQFDSDTERICIDTGASAFLSTKKANFVSIQEIDNVKINSIASGLRVSGIGVLKWSIRDDKNNEINLFSTANSATNAETRRWIEGIESARGI
jgi:hypothetical protein